MKLRVGVIGLGQAWESRHAPALRALTDRFEVRAFCDPVAHRAAEIAQRWPALRFRLAQSVEPQLPVEESWAGVPARQLQQQVERWRVRLQPVGVTGIDWQDWTHYPH